MKTKSIFRYTFIVLLIAATVLACKKDDESQSEKFLLLTNHVWVNDSLLADGIESGGSGEILEDFTGDTKFNTDGTGYIGTFTGDWFFNADETKITIHSDSLLMPVTTNVVELTETSLKITTSFPSQIMLGVMIDVRMTFKPK